jgi:phage-related protein
MSERFFGSAVNGDGGGRNCQGHGAGRVLLDIFDWIYSYLRPVQFLGDSLKYLREFPAEARHDAGYQLDRVQRGGQPADFKPMPTIGKGVEELRVSDEIGANRVVYVARRAKAVHVLHAFQKKTRATSRRDIEIAKRRFREIPGGTR